MTLMIAVKRPKRPAWLTVACPTCGSTADEDCRTLTNYCDSRVTRPHKARRDRAARSPR